MPIKEFALIEKYFNCNSLQRGDVILGIGDDCAVLQPPSNTNIAVTTDTLVADVHFHADDDPFNIGYKAIAVNLSDLAAIGAEPAWITMALTLSQAEDKWLADFATGCFELLNKYNVQLIGGDLTHGPFTITVQAFGFIPIDQAIKRSTAKHKDAIYVTGNLGDAGLALQTNTNFLPHPRINEGILLRGIANSMIDISDGLAQDLDHILQQSNVGAFIDINKIPLSENITTSLPLQEAQKLALTAGDDYELCFTVPPEKDKQLKSQLKSFNCECTKIGVIEQDIGLRIKSNSRIITINETGYEHEWK